MQFMLIPENGPEKFHEWEADFKEIYAWLESLQPPAYPFAIDRVLAASKAKRSSTPLRRVPRPLRPRASYPNKIVADRRAGHRSGPLAAHHAEPSGRLRRQLVRPLWRTTTWSPIRAATWRRRWMASGPRPRTSTMARCPRCGTSCTRPSGRRSGSAPRTATTGERSAWKSPRSSRCPRPLHTARERRSYFDTSKFGKSAAGPPVSRRARRGREARGAGIPEDAVNLTTPRTRGDGSGRLRPPRLLHPLVNDQHLARLGLAGELAGPLGPRSGCSRA